jgi:hypothetical protein
MINYRKYDHVNDYDLYKSFCEKNFGKKCYQSKIEHINWLESNKSHFIDIAVKENEILGCFHGFEAPVKINNETHIFCSLHDLMVDREKGSQIGFKLMQEVILQDNPVILSGAIGRISRAYKRLGSIQFQSHWYRKFIFPLNPLRFFFLKERFVKFVQNEMNFNFINNKDKNSKTQIQSIINSYKYDYDFSKKFFEWRFFQPDSPLTFFAYDDSFKNVVTFSIGLRGLIPFLRIMSVIKDDDETLIDLLKSIERFACKIGIPVILYSVTEDIPPPKNLKYNKYKDMPNSFVYSNKKNFPDNFSINGFSTDLGFDSHFYKGIDERI